MGSARSDMVRCRRCFVVEFKDRVRLKPDSDTSRLNPNLAGRIGIVSTVRFVDGPTVAATVRFDDTCLKHVPVKDLLLIE